MSDAVRQIKEKLPLLDILQEYLDFTQAGDSWKARCPFHNEKTASFHVTPAENVFYCFGCHRGGDLFSFIQEHENMTFKEALVMLAEKAGVILDGQIKKPSTNSEKLLALMRHAADFYHRQLLLDSEVKQYLVERGLTEATVRLFRLGYASTTWDSLTTFLKASSYTEQDMLDVGLIIARKDAKGGYDRFRNRIMFPLNDPQGRVVGFSGRIFDARVENKEKAGGKYINSPESEFYDKSSILYGYDCAKKSISYEKSCIIVEGQMDLVMAHQANTKHCVALSGTALSERQLTLLARSATKLIFALDADSAGSQAVTRSVLATLEKDLDVAIVQLPVGADPADVIRTSPETWHKLLEKPLSYITWKCRDMRNSDARTLRSILIRDVFPALLSMKSPIILERALQEASTHSGYTFETLSKEFRTWQSNNKDALESFEPISDSLSSKALTLDDTSSDTSRIGTSSKESRLITLSNLIHLAKQRTESNENPDDVVVYAEEILSRERADWRERLQEEPRALIETHMMYGNAPLKHIFQSIREVTFIIKRDILTQQRNNLHIELRRSADMPERRNELLTSIQNIDSQLISLNDLYHRE